jgi:hypothetical protein
MVAGLALASAFLSALGVWFWSAAANSERKSLAERREHVKDWYAKIRERQKMSALVRRSQDATLAGVAEYLDGGSIGYVFTNRLGNFTVFLPHPGMREDWDQGKSRSTVRIRKCLWGRRSPEPVESK